MASHFCQKCATEITPTTRKCPTCGAKIVPPKIDRPVADTRFEDAHPSSPERNKPYQPKPVTRSSSEGSPLADQTYKIRDSLPKEMADKLKDWGLESDQAFFYVILSAFIPWLGFIFMYIFKKEKPQYLKAVYIGTTIGMIFFILMQFLRYTN